jgi:hypothetical protein
MSSSWRARASLSLCFVLTASVASPAAAAWDEPPRRATIYLNFEGAALKKGGNAALGESRCVSGPVDYPASARDEAARAAIVQIVRDKLAPYAVRVVTEAPPPELPYTMVMLGGTPSVIGEEPSTFAQGCGVDCGNALARDTAVVFTDFEVSDKAVAFGALVALGPILGLDHIEGDEHIMYTYIDIGTQDKVWSTECVPIDESATFAKCGYVHEEFCPSGQQNDDAELLAFFGANSPDVEPPQVELLAPADGAELPGGDVAVVAAVSDDHEGFGWKLVVYQGDEVLFEAPAFAGETSWNLAGLSPGVYRVEVAAIDHDRNVGRDEATIHVGVPAPEGSTGEASDTDVEVVTDGGDNSTGDGAGGGAGGGADTGGEQEDGEKGCACELSSSPSGGSLAALLGLCGLRRRRR